MSRRTTITGAAIVLSLAAISAGTWGLSKWRPFEHKPATIAWPHNLQPVVDFIPNFAGHYGLQWRIRKLNG